ncbi:hypothetical protein D3H35_00740 [Cohnella faecalis]|uniref:Uncharacterized protein n=1 Tax=Cohnella faecalis TaxID=2315694 RepID=A0A398D1H6_9BACL|nr:hypothetical protein D3H35_00740 [Cohnella faecalis]
MFATLVLIFEIAEKSLNPEKYKEIRLERCYSGNWNVRNRFQYISTFDSVKNSPIGAMAYKIRYEDETGFKIYSHNKSKSVFIKRFHFYLKMMPSISKALKNLT